MHVLGDIGPLSLGLVAAGVAGGIAYVLWSWLRALLQPLSELLFALRPLAIPLLVIAAAATVNFSALAQLVVAVVLIVGVYRLIIWPEIGQKSEPGQQIELKWWKRISAIALVVVGILIVLFSIISLDSLLSGQAGPAGAFLVVALAALVGAALARLAGYAIGTQLRMLLRLPVVILLVLATGYAAAWAGIVFADPDGGDMAVRLYVLAGVAVVVAIVGEPLLKRYLPSSASETDEAASKRRDDLRRTFAGIGLSLATVAGGLVMAATTASLIQLARSGGESVKTRDRGPVPSPLYGDANAAVEYVHAPVLAFTEDQPWTPISVNEYFTDYNAHVERKDKSRVNSSDGTYKCPSLGPQKCLRVTIECPAAADPCATPDPTGPHERGDHVSSGLIYVRVLRRKPPRDDDPDDVVARRGLFEPLRPKSLPEGGKEGIAHKTQVLLQYWFFYPYDEWTTRALGASFTQRHEGDWESVSVGLGAGDRPLFVAYSAHCGGSWKPWDDTVRYATHPLVAVARGSHGNYPNAGEHRVPDFTSCIRIQRGIGTLLAFAANVQDVTADRWEWGADRVETVDENDWPMNFPGTWGGNDIVQLKTRRSFPENPVSGAGPASPPLQPLWQDPIRTIFCDRYWDHPKRQSCKQALRPGSDNPPA